jgi:hypothetical protein
MRTSFRLMSTLVVLIVLFSLSSVATAGDKENPFRFQYAAKFTCGAVPPGDTDRVIPGQYATAVAVHNPQSRDVTLRKKIALVFPPGAEQPGRVSDFITLKLGPDQALEVSCQEIPSEFLPDTTSPYVQGFLVIETTRSVDVTATYSAGPITITRPPSAPSISASTSTVASVHVEHIRERALSDEEADSKKEKDKDKEKH